MIIQQRSLLALSVGVAAIGVLLAVIAAATGMRGISWIASISVALVCVGHAWVISRQPVETDETHGQAAARFARDLIWPFAILFAWGTGVFALGYGLTDLYWQHWWQYALVFALLLIITAGCARALSSPAVVAPDRSDPAFLVRALTLTTGLQGVLALCGLVFLAASGKLEADKPDWLANHVFMAGGIAIALMSLAALNGQLRAARLTRLTT